ncbi:MAG: AsmA family protein [Myxococcota bacterium]|nr:AsmA family protein [Myxococcota bacterium]
MPDVRDAAARVARRRRVAALAGVAVALAAALLVGGFWLAASLRPWLEEALGAALSRPVEIGSVRPLVSLYPGLALADVRVENPPGSAEPLLLEVAGFEARLDLPALLRRELRVRGLQMRDGRLIVGGAVSTGGEGEAVDPRSQLELLRSLAGEQRLRAIHVELVADDGTRSVIQLERADLRGCGEPAEARATLGASAVELAGTLDCTPQGPALGAARLRIGESALRGRVALHFERTGLRVEVDADTEELLVDDLMAVGGDDSEPSSTPALDQPLAPDLFGDPELDLTLRAQAVYADAGVVRDLDLRLISEPGRLRASIARARIAEGLVTAELEVDTARDPVSASLKLAVDAARLDTLAPDVFAEGNGILDVDVSSEGATPRDLLAGASGRAQLSLSEARLGRASLGVLGRDLRSLLPSRDGAERSRRLHCAVARVTLEAGTGAVLAVVDTPDTTLAGGGSLDLPAFSANLLLKPRPRRASVGAVKTPIRIAGALDALRVSVDKGELAKATGKALGFALLNPLVALVDLGVKGNPCQEAIDQALGELPQTEAAASPATEDAAGSPAPEDAARTPPTDGAPPPAGIAPEPEPEPQVNPTR